MELSQAWDNLGRRVVHRNPYESESDAKELGAITGATDSYILVRFDKGYISVPVPAEQLTLIEEP
jgi:hypothetical protein